MNADEAELLQRVFAREPGAFEALLERYRALIYSVFHGPSFRFPYDYMEDLYQGFVLALSRDDYRKLRAFEGRNKASLATFLQVVTTRYALDERRKWRRHPRGWGDAGRDDDEPRFEQADTTTPPPDAPTLEQEQLDTFHNLLFSLDWKRISAVLWVFRDVQREFIAEVMSTSRANIDALYKRAKDQMTDLFAGGAGERQVRRADPEVLTPEIQEALRGLLVHPLQRIHQALLQPGAKRDALLGMVLAEYPRFLCSRAELAKIAGKEPVEQACLRVLAETRRRLGGAA